jgi:phosphonate transport system ATP-binding protein
VGVARERGITLVCTLHQVEMALAHFPRVLALQDGAVAFDLPTPAVTRDRLEQLYARHPGELYGPAPLAEAGPEVQAPAPVVMHCR